MKIETEDFDETKVTLDTYNSDLNLNIDAARFAAKPLTHEGFAFMWAGVRATHGASKGKFCFEVKILENLSVDHLPADEPNPHVVRVGFSVETSTMQLGEDPLSYGYGGTGKISTNCQFKDFGQSFAAGDVILGAVNADTDMVQIGFAKNGKFLGWAYRVGKGELKGKALFPHVLTKNVSFEVNLGQKDKPYFPLPDQLKDFALIGCLAADKREGGTRAPKRREDCEMIMMCGIPGAGKSYWAADYAAKNPHKKYNVLGTNNIIDKMKIMGLPRKRNYHGRWEVLIQMATKCLNKLFEIGSKLRRNFILDQTNVYPTAQRRKMRNFEGFLRKAVVVVPSEAEYKKRCDKRDREEGKEVPDHAVLEMKANFKLPDVCDIFSEVIFTDLQKEDAEKLVAQYNEEGKEAVGPPRKQFKASDGSGSRFDSGRDNHSGSPSRGGFSPRGDFERGRGGFRGGFDRNRGGFEGSRGGFDGPRGGFDGPRGGRGGFDGPRGGFDRNRGGFDGGRGGFDRNRGGFERGRGSFDRNRGGRGGFDGGREDFDGRRSGRDFDRNRGEFDGSRGGFDRNREGFEGNRGGFDRNRGGFDGNGRGGMDRNRGFDGDRGSFDRRGGYGGSRGGFEGGHGGFEGSRGGFDRNRGGRFDNGQDDYDTGYGNGAERGGFNKSRGSFEGGRGGFDRSRNFDDSASGARSSPYNSGARNSPGGYNSGARDSPGGYNSGARNSPGGYGEAQSNYGDSNSFRENSRGGRGDYSSGRPPAQDAYSSAPRGGGYRGGSSHGGNSYSQDSSGGYGQEPSSRGYGHESSGYGSTGSYQSEYAGGAQRTAFKKEAESDSGARSTRASGRASRWSADTSSQPASSYQANPAPAQDKPSYSSYTSQVKAEPVENTYGYSSYTAAVKSEPADNAYSSYDSYSSNTPSYTSYVPPSQPTQGYQTTQQTYGYQTTAPASNTATPQAWQQPPAAAQPPAQQDQQQQWAQYYQQQQYYNQYYGQQQEASAAAPSYGSSAYGGK